MLNMTAPRADADKITAIVARADGACRLAGGQKIDRIQVAMSLTACHLNGCPLDLDKLAGFDNFNLLHDVSGIHRHVSRDDGKLMDCFLPRSAARA